VGDRRENFASSKISTLALELVTRTISIGNIKKHKVIIELDTKRCAAEDVLLRTFCSSPAQGLGGWCAGLVWEWLRDCEIWRSAEQNCANTPNEIARQN
jgi:hypothetical protein